MLNIIKAITNTGTLGAKITAVKIKENNRFNVP